MKRCRVAYIMAFLFCLSPAIGASEDESEEGTLFPGESSTIHGVTMTWEISEVQTSWKIADKLYPGIDSAGTLSFQGPTQRISVDLFSEKNIPDTTDEKTEEAYLYAYLDEVRFMVIVGIETRHDGERMRARIKQMPFNAVRQPSKWTFDGRESNQSLHVSSVSPLSLDHWRISISQEPVRYPDGSEYYELAAQDTQSGTKNTMPVTEGAAKKFGRFNIRIGQFFEATRTANLEIEVQRDLSVRGRGANIEHFDLQENETLGHFLERLGEKYGFKIEWVESPGHPESIEYTRNLTHHAIAGFENLLVSELVDGVCSSYVMGDPLRELGWEWTDPTHLRVWAKNYGDVIADNERKAREEEEQKHVEAEEQQERSQFEATFREKYALRTEVYPLEKMSAATAKGLIDPEVQSYFLIPTGIVGVITPGRGISVQEEGKHFGIYSAREETVKDLPSFLIAKSDERAISDERTNALILTAIPKTHGKVSEILGTMDNLLRGKEQSLVPRPYRVETVLLTGKKKEAKADEPLLVGPGLPGGVEYDPKLAEIYGVSKQDLEFFGLVVLGELAKGFASVLGARGEEGRAKIALTSTMSCEIEFLDRREPYLVVKVRLLGPEPSKVLFESYNPSQPVSNPQLLGPEPSKVLFENTLYLEKDKPSVLGLTNLREALILVLRLRDTPSEISREGEAPAEPKLGRRDARR